MSKLPSLLTIGCLLVNGGSASASATSTATTTPPSLLLIMDLEFFLNKDGIVALSSSSLLHLVLKLSERLSEMTCLWRCKDADYLHLDRKTLWSFIIPWGEAFMHTMQLRWKAKGLLPWGLSMDRRYHSERGRILILCQGQGTLSSRKFLWEVGLPKGNGGARKFPRGERRLTLECKGMRDEN